MNIFIISGGTIDDLWATNYIKQNKNRNDLVIAADRGVEFLQRSGMKPDYIIGDFDSASETAKQALEDWQVPITTLPTHKDDTDTEAAVELALILLEKSNTNSVDRSIDAVDVVVNSVDTSANAVENVDTSATAVENVDTSVVSGKNPKIHIIGGTGTRLDHVLGNISMLGKGLEKNIVIFLADPHNRIRMIDKDHPFEMTTETQYGKYVSSVPFTTKVTGVHMTGMEYPLHDAVLEGFSSLGISNEIKENETGRITIDSGILIVIESKD